MGNLTAAPGEAAMTAYAQASHQSMLSGSLSGNALTLQYSTVPNAGTSTFNGTANAHSSVNTLTIDENGALVGTSTSTDYYLLNPLVPLGIVYANGTPFAVVSSSSPLPATINVGGSGSFESLTLYHDSTLAVVDAMITETYTVRANDSTTLLLCIDTEVSDITAAGSADGLVADTETDCYTIDASGNAAIFSITVTVSGTTVTFT